MEDQHQAECQASEEDHLDDQGGNEIRCHSEPDVHEVYLIYAYKVKPLSQLKCIIGGHCDCISEEEAVLIDQIVAKDQRAFG